MYVSKPINLYAVNNSYLCKMPHFLTVSPEPLMLRHIHLKAGKPK